MREPKISGKHWNKDLESPIYESWKKKNRYKFNPNDKKPVYSIDTPPPYVNAPVHIGQSTTYILMDMFARFKRMTGYNVLFPLGLDRNGLPIEMAAEKKFKIRHDELPREEFIKRCKELLEKSSLASVDTFFRTGISFNSWNIGTGIGEIYLTDSDDYRRLTQETFIDLWNDNLIYEDERINNYCPGCKTTIADAEIEYKDIHTFFNDIIFKVKETGEEIEIGTTRPELVCTCGMVIFNPEDDRWKHLEGKTAITPIFEKEIPIKSHPMAEIEKGTGLVMMCSVGDLSDIRFFREMKLEPVIAINQDGKMNENAGFLKGLKVREAREKMIDELKNKSLLVEQKQVVHRTPICERSKDEIEFISMSELYCKQIDFKDEMKKIAKSTNFFSPRSRQILLNWIDSVSIDWPISRRRYYATEVPLWYCEKCEETIIPPKGKYYKPWKEKPPVEKCPKCKSKKFKGDERVFDTWFDSSNSPIYILKYSRDDKFFKKNKPCSLRPQGKEIVRSWLYYTLLKNYLLNKDSIFKDVWVNFHILDNKGHKMSKSLGNVIDPKEVIDKLGSEPFRLWSATEGNLDRTDFRCSFERIEGAGKTLTKLWNVSRFISMFPSPKKPKKLLDLDKWIIQEINELIKFSNESYEKYDFHNPSIKIKHFLWETFASHYLELVKKRAYNENKRFTKEEEKAAQYTLHYCLEIMLTLLSPIIPFITYRIYDDLKRKDIHSEKFPQIIKEYKIPFTKENITELNSKIWKSKKDKGLSLKDEIKNITLPEKFKTIMKDVQNTHNISEIKFGKELKISF